ncbi:MAG: IclR family transcriptional regulator [Eubacteriales bacterium]|nr:IclR family transcriptional regulator [Eubacteriales bacterium]
MLEEPKYPVQTVMKAIEVINELSKNENPKGVSLSELSRSIGLGKSTIHRILDTLYFYGWVDKDEETSRYRLGWELYKIGQTIPGQNDVQHIDQKYLVNLWNEVDGTVSLGVLKKGETVILSRMEAVDEKSIVNVGLGAYESIYATSIGKMLISEMNAEQIRDILGPGGFTQHTPHTITTFKDLLREIQITRQRGYAVDAEEYSIGTICMAMPVRDYTEKIVAAVSVSSPVSVMTIGHRRKILHALDSATSKISRSLGYERA